jgi:hypothetical protein
VRLADADVSTAIEALCPLAARAGHLRTRPGPRDPELRHARTCYDHMAGHLAVLILDHLLERGLLVREDAELRMTDAGRSFFSARGIPVATLETSRRPSCRVCLDWSERRHHLGGSLGAAILTVAEAQGFVRRDRGTRILRFGRNGEARIQDWLAIGAGRHAA